MSKVIAPFIFFVIAVGLFFSYIDPAYKAVQALKVQEARLEKALADTKALTATRNTLLARFQDLSQYTPRLNKLLPDNVDNVRLIIDIDSIAATYGLTARDYAFNAVRVAAAASADTEQGEPLGTAGLSFSVVGQYKDFKSFMYDIESSLRLIDITSFAVDAQPIQVEGETMENNYKFVISIETYWLK